MANAKELRKQIGSVKNTQKITRAMQMVAASKMRKAQERMARGRPYSDQIRSVISHMANASSEYPHQFMRERAVTRVGYIVVTTDKGLCGGLNTNLFKALVKDMAGNREQGIISLAITIVLAAIFTGFQAFEYLEAPFTISDGIYGSSNACYGWFNIH